MFELRAIYTDTIILHHVMYRTSFADVLIHRYGLLICRILISSVGFSVLLSYNKSVQTVISQSSILSVNS